MVDPRDPPLSGGKLAPSRGIVVRHIFAGKVDRRSVNQLGRISTTMHRSLKSGIYLKVFLENSIEYHSTYPSAKFYRD